VGASERLKAPPGTSTRERGEPIVVLHADISQNQLKFHLGFFLKKEYSKQYILICVLHPFESKLPNPKTI
jgi:hypothetical protein